MVQDSIIGIPETLYTYEIKIISLLHFGVEKIKCQKDQDKVTKTEAEPRNHTYLSWYRICLLMQTRPIMRLHYPSNETKGGPGSRKSVKALGKFIVIFPFDLHLPNSN